MHAPFFGLRFCALFWALNFALLSSRFRAPTILVFHARIFALFVFSHSYFRALASTTMREKPEQDRQNGTGRKGKADMTGQDMKNGTGRMGQLQRDRHNRTGRKGKAEQDMKNETGRMGQSERDRQNSNALCNAAMVARQLSPTSERSQMFGFKYPFTFLLIHGNHFARCTKMSM
jgi:hypothetical protein